MMWEEHVARTEEMSRVLKFGRKAQQEETTRSMCLISVFRARSRRELLSSGLLRSE